MKSNSLKVQIWKYLSIFSIFILSFLWLFQVLFLNKFYEFSKIKQLDNTINLIKESYNNNSLYSNVDNYAEDNGICIQIFTDKKIICVFIPILYSAESVIFARYNRITQNCYCHA